MKSPLRESRRKRYSRGGLKQMTLSQSRKSPQEKDKKLSRQVTD
jgi:hypothetical protein